MDPRIKSPGDERGSAAPYLRGKITLRGRRDGRTDERCAGAALRGDRVAQGAGAVEVGIEPMRADRTRIVAESADLLYHLLVLWADAGVGPDEIWTELA